MNSSPSGTVGTLAPPGGVPTPVPRRLLAGLSASFALALVAVAACAAGGVIGGWDRAGLRHLHAAGSSAAAVATAATRLGDGLPLLAVVTGLGLLATVALRRGLQPVVLPLVAVVVASTLSTLLKVDLALPRPPRDGWLSAAGGYAFPSGHTTAGTAGFLTLALVTAALLSTRWARGLVLASGVLAAAAVGWTRVALGVHWPSDVVGGWLLGAAVATAVTAALARPRAGDSRSGRT